MTATAIVSEYNPFHNGHKYHIEETRKNTNSDFIVCVMSSNFVQRGEPAVINKWARTKSALLCGADLVIELPCLYACSSAEYFANAAVDIINKTQSINYISFGSDTGDLDLLKAAVNNRIENENNMSDMIISAHKSGLSYPKAMQLIYNEPTFNSNDILALLYLTALNKTNSKVVPVAIKRKGSSYNDKQIRNDSPSAQAIRKYITDSNDYSILYQIMPEDSATILIQEINEKRTLTLNSFDKQIMTILRLLTPSGITNLPHVTPGLEYRVYKNATNFTNLSDLIDNTISATFTRTRIQRLCTAALLGINQGMLSKRIDVPYIRVLGFKEKAIPFLKLLKENSLVPLMIRPKKDYDNLSLHGKKLFDLEAKASDVYVLGYENNLYSKGKQEFTNELIIL